MIFVLGLFIAAAFVYASWPKKSCEPDPYPDIQAFAEAAWRSHCHCKPFRLEGDIPGDFKCAHCGKVWGWAGAPTHYR